jgi:hypothetical protein
VDKKQIRQELNQFGLFKFKHNIVRIYFGLQTPLATEGRAGKER